VAAPGPAPLHCTTALLRAGNARRVSALVCTAGDKHAGEFSPSGVDAHSWSFHVAPEPDRPNTGLTTIGGRPWSLRAVDKRGIPMQLSKLEAARRQLETAIKLYFEYGMAMRCLFMLWRQPPIL